jgi:hypothetical protein
VLACHRHLANYARLLFVNVGSLKNWSMRLSRLDTRSGP